MLIHADPCWSHALSNHSLGDLLTLETLGGGLARTQPQLYRVPDTPDAADSYSLWLKEMVDHFGIRNSPPPSLACCVILLVYQRGPAHTRPWWCEYCPSACLLASAATHSLHHAPLAASLCTLHPTLLSHAALTMYVHTLHLGVTANTSFLGSALQILEHFKNQITGYVRFSDVAGSPSFNAALTFIAGTISGGCARLRSLAATAVPMSLFAHHSHLHGYPQPYPCA